MSSGLEPLTPLLGEWVAESKAFAEGRGHTTVTLTEDGKLMRVHSIAEDQRFPESLMIVGADEASDDYTALYHDSRGVYRVYRMRLAEGKWTIWREAPNCSAMAVRSTRSPVRKFQCPGSAPNRCA